MYSQRFGTVPREFKGPTPKAVIIVSTGYLCGKPKTLFRLLVEPDQFFHLGSRFQKQRALGKKRLLLADLSFHPILFHSNLQLQSPLGILVFLFFL